MCTRDLFGLRNRPLRLLRQRGHLAAPSRYARPWSQGARGDGDCSKSRTWPSARRPAKCRPAKRGAFLIARALVHDPQALILDEPTTSLDLRATHELREISRKLAWQRHRHHHGDAPSAGHHSRRWSAWCSSAKAGLARWRQAGRAGSGRPGRTFRHPGGGAGAWRVLSRAVARWGGGPGTEMKRRKNTGGKRPPALPRNAAG